MAILAISDENQQIFSGIIDNFALQNEVKKLKCRNHNSINILVSRAVLETLKIFLGNILNLRRILHSEKNL